MKEGEKGNHYRFQNIVQRIKRARRHMLPRHGRHPERRPARHRKLRRGTATDAHTHATGAAATAFLALLFRLLDADDSRVKRVQRRDGREALRVRLLVVQMQARVRRRNDGQVSAQRRLDFSIAMVSVFFFFIFK